MTPGWWLPDLPQMVASRVEMPSKTVILLHWLYVCQGSFWLVRWLGSYTWTWQIANQLRLFYRQTSPCCKPSMSELQQSLPIAQVLGDHPANRALCLQTLSRSAWSSSRLLLNSQLLSSRTGGSTSFTSCRIVACSD